MRKFLSIVLALAMLLSMAAFATAEEPITVTVFRGDPGDQPTADNKIYKLIEETFGITFEIEFLAGDLDETLGVKIAGKDYPDLFDGGNSAEKIENAGALIDLLEYINPEDTPRLWAHIEDILPQLVTDDGKLYIIPNYGINYNAQISNYCNGPAFWIQKQVLEWAGYPEIKTLNEYFDVIEAFIEANPTNEEGIPYTGFAILCESWRHFCLINPVQHLMGRPNDGEVLVDINDNYKTETFINQDYAKAYYVKLNEEYQKGLISKDTFVMNYDQYIQALSSGTVLGMFDQYWDFGDATRALETAGMYENTYIGLGLVYDPEYVDGAEIEEHYLNGAVPNKDRGFGISVNCEYPERLVAMFEEMLSDEWQTILSWGIEGEDYYVEDGRMLMTAEQYANTKDTTWIRANKAKAVYESMPKKQGTMDNGNAWEVGNQPELYFGEMSEYDQAFLAAYGKNTPAEFFNSPIELAPYGEAWQIDKTPINVDYQDFLTLQDKYLPEIIMCDPADVDALWDEFVEAITPSATVYTEFMQAEVLKLVEKATN